MSPERKVPAVVYVKRREEEDVRETHSADVQADPAARSASHRPPGKDRRRERKGPEDKEVVVVGPAHRGQDCHRSEDHRQAAVVQGAEFRMPARTLGTEHRDEARDHAAEAGRDVHREHGEECRRVRWDWDPANGDRTLVHLGARPGWRGPTLRFSGERFHASPDLNYY